MTDRWEARIEKLERQNRRMRAAIAVLCLFLGALLTMGQVLPRKTDNRMERLEVREITLSDGVMNAKLTPNSLVFSAKSGFEAERTAITASGLTTGGRYATELKPTGLICSRDGVPRFDLSVGEIGAALAIKNGSGHLGTMLDETTMVLINDGGMLSLRPDHLFLQRGEADTLLSSSSLRIRDTNKHKAILGQAYPASKSDKAQGKSAASLILLGQDDSVIYRAP